MWWEEEEGSNCTCSYDLVRASWQVKACDYLHRLCDPPVTQQSDYIQQVLETDQLTALTYY